MSSLPEPFPSSISRLAVLLVGATPRLPPAGPHQKVNEGAQIYNAAGGRSWTLPLSEIVEICRKKMSPSGWLGTYKGGDLHPHHFFGRPGSGQSPGKGSVDCHPSRPASWGMMAAPSSGVNCQIHFPGAGRCRHPPATGRVKGLRVEIFPVLRLRQEKYYPALDADTGLRRSERTAAAFGESARGEPPSPNSSPLELE